MINYKSIFKPEDYLGHNWKKCSKKTAIINGGYSFLCLDCLTRVRDLPNCESSWFVIVYNNSKHIRARDYDIIKKEKARRDLGSLTCDEIIIKNILE